MSSTDFQNGLIVGLTANGINLVQALNKIDTEENWTTSNPILDNGELIIVVTADGSKRLKAGDGVTPFTELDYIDSNISEELINQKTQVQLITWEDDD